MSPATVVNVPPAAKFSWVEDVDDEMARMMHLKDVAIKAGGATADTKAAYNAVVRTLTGGVQKNTEEIAAIKRQAKAVVADAFPNSSSSNYSATHLKSVAIEAGGATADTKAAYNAVVRTLTGCVQKNTDEIAAIKRHAKAVIADAFPKKTSSSDNSSSSSASQQKKKLLPNGGGSNTAAQANGGDADAVAAENAALRRQLQMMKENAAMKTQIEQLKKQPNAGGGGGGVRPTVPRQKKNPAGGIVASQEPQSKQQPNMTKPKNETQCRFDHLPGGCKKPPGECGFMHKNQPRVAVPGTPSCNGSVASSSS